MKSVVFILTFWGCVCSACIANASGFYSGRVLVGDFASFDEFDTADISTLRPDLINAAQIPIVLPQPGSKLNYTQIMFEHAQVTGADEYLVEVALDNGDNAFEHPLFRHKDSSTAVILSNFEFGKKYVWRYTVIQQGKETGWLGPYNFEIINNECVDKKNYRVRILENDSLQNAGGLITLDMKRCIDRNGNFVWFLPGQNTWIETTGQLFTAPLEIEDLRITPLGTVTLLNGADAEEVDLQGKIIWKAPESVSANTGLVHGYHHCFSRLQNGNYMVLDQNCATNAALSGDTAMLSYEIIKEFNHSGKLVWNWSSKNYFNAAEWKKTGLDKRDPVLRNRLPGGHMNAFDVDEKNGFVYAGFRNASRVIKIDKKTGNVVCAWGQNMTYNDKPNGEGFFAKQHGTTLLHDGSIAVFNNSVSPDNTEGNLSGSSSVIIFTQPTNDSSSRMVWQYDCVFDSKNDLSRTGGNVDELKNGNLLVGMGDWNRAFEVTRNKEVVWNAVIEAYAGDGSGWVKFPVYRAHYASSLYPCYFTVQTNTQVLKNGQQAFELKIFNDGSEDDSYQVVISSAFGNYKKQYTTGVLSSKKSISTTVASGNEATGALTVTVTSKTNPDFKRVVHIN